MFWLKLKRVIRAGFVSFWRNGFVSLAAVLVMTVTLFTIGTTVFSGALLRSSLQALKDKVDVNVYFVTSAPEDQILALKKTLEAMPEVDKVDYISRAEALAAFKARHEADQLTLQALEELPDNPLGAALTIKAKDTVGYDSVVKSLKSDSFLDANQSQIIDKINYDQNKPAIDKLVKISDASSRLGIAIVILLVVISIIITFNTIRLAIFISKDEISVMRLVGASGRYIQGPFVVEGILYGAVSAFFTLAIFYPLTLWLGPFTSNFFIGFNVYHYYLDNFSQFFLLTVLTGILLGAISSFLAVRKHLRV